MTNWTKVRRESYARTASYYDQFCCNCLHALSSHFGRPGRGHDDSLQTGSRFTPVGKAVCEPRTPFAGAVCVPFTPLGREPFRLLTSVHASPDGAADSNRSRVWWISRPRHPFLRLQATSIITLLSTDFQYGRETDPLVPCAYPRPSRRVAPKPLFSVRQLERGASHLTKNSAGHMCALGQVHPLV